MKKIRLLIVESHTAVRRALTIRLRSSPAIQVVATASAVADVADELLQLQPELVLFGLQKRGGHVSEGLVGDVRRLIDLGIQVVVLVAYHDDDERELLQAAGVSRFLLKAIDTPRLIDELVSAVRPGTDASPLLSSNPNPGNSSRFR